MSALEALDRLAPIERDTRASLRRLFDPLTQPTDAMSALRNICREARRDLDAMLHDVIEVCAEYAGASGGFIHVWDAAQQRLVIRAAALSDQRWVGMYPMALGEGIVGWCALNAKPILLTRNPTQDPRIFRIKEMGDDIIQTHVVVPAIEPCGKVMGTISLRALREDAFGEDVLSILMAVAQLVGMAIESTLLAEGNDAQSAALRRVGDLPEDTSTEAAVQRTLHSIAACAGELLQADETFIFGTEPGAANAHSDATWSVGGRERLADLSGARTALIDALGVGALSAPIAELILREAGVLDAKTRVFLVENLRIDGRTVGILFAAGTERRLSDSQRDLATVLASRAANVLERVRIKAAGTFRDRTAQIINELASGKFLPEAIEARADRSGIDLKRRSVVILAQWADTGSDAHSELDLVSRSLRRLASSVVITSTPGRIAAILPLRRSQSAASIADQVRSDMAAHAAVDGAIAIGISEPCAGSAQFPEAFRQAQDVVDLMQLDPQSSFVSNFGAMASMAHLKSIARAGRRDPYQEALLRLMIYDDTHGTSLYQTLEMYLSCGGNSKTTADLLTLHRNTLRQRLARCNEVMDLDITHSEMWFDLGLAARVVRMRRCLGLERGQS